LSLILGQAVIIYAAKEMNFLNIQYKYTALQEGKLAAAAGGHSFI